MTWDLTIEALKAEFPSFRLVPKDESRLMRFLARVMFWNPEFMDRFTVTLGSTIYMPRNTIGTLGGAAILKHEAVHMRDFKKYHLFYLLSYITLPIGPSGRAYWEFRGYKESMKAHYEQHGVIPDWLIEFYVSLFVGPSYLFMFPFPGIVRGWFTKLRKEILDEQPLP